MQEAFLIAFGMLGAANNKNLVAAPLGGNAMNDKDRLAGFKALLKSEQANAFHLMDHDGEFKLWRDLSAEGKLEAIARDAAYYDIAFEQFAEASRESVDAVAIEDAALRLAMRSHRELHELEKLLPDDRLEPASLAERVSELLNANSSEHLDEAWLTAKERTALFEEMRTDEAAAKREDAHWYGKMTLQELLNEKAKSPAVEKGTDRGIER